MAQWQLREWVKKASLLADLFPVTKLHAFYFSDTAQMLFLKDITLLVA